MDPDLPLMAALQAGDDAALNELINRHQGHVYAFVSRYLRNDAAARDLTQETFVRVYFKAAQFVPRATVKTWIFAIALNLCRDRARRLASSGLSISLDTIAGTERVAGRLMDDAELPSKQAADADQCSFLQTAIDQLPRHLREVIILCSLEERPQREVAELLGTSIKAVETRLYQAKAKLRDAFARFR